MHDWQFTVEVSDLEAGWLLQVLGIRRWSWGPYPTEDAARAAEHQIFRRWAQAAQGRGGWVWRKTSEIWVVTTPAGVEVGGTPMCREACSVHHVE